MVYRILFLLVLLCLVCNAQAQFSEQDSLLKALDEAILKKKSYALIRQNQIDSLKAMIPITASDKDLFKLYKDLYGKYHAFKLDSALWAANKRLDLARLLKDPVSLHAANLNLSEALAGMGMYKESLEILDAIPREELDYTNDTYYLNLYHDVYDMMREYALPQDLKEMYSRLAYGYKDSIMLQRTPESLGYQLKKGEKLMYEGKVQEAIDIFRHCFEVHQERGYNLAIPALSLAEAYEKNGQKDLQMKYLAISSIADIQVGNKEYISLWKLAKLLFEEGDVKRANTYIGCSMQDAMFSNSRYRMQEISNLLPSINDGYGSLLKEERDQSRQLLWWVSILAVILLVAVVFIYVQNRKVRAARRSLKEVNNELKSVNENLLSLNKQLKESNNVKEEYIGYVFNLCSLFINKQENQRKTYARKIKTGQIEDLYNLVNNTTTVNAELNEFLHTFDQVFLTLYPNFVEEFNKLLIPDDQIHPKNGDLLTSELRVFALYRLGITDSGKIATFLHYSSQTVYNYKLRTRNKSPLSKEEFYQAVSRIG